MSSSACCWHGVATWVASKWRTFTEYVTEHNPQFAWALALINGSFLIVVGGWAGNAFAILPTTCETSHFAATFEHDIFIFSLITMVGAFFAIMAVISNSLGPTVVSILYTSIPIVSIGCYLTAVTPERLEAKWASYVAACPSPVPGKWLWNPWPTKL